MKRLTLSVALAVATVVNAFACTNLIVGKNASADGSTIVSYSADSYGLFGELYHYPAGIQKCIAGTWQRADHSCKRNFCCNRYWSS